MIPAQASIRLIDQVIALLEQMNDEQYQQCREIFDGSTFAAHMRHILEFYLLVINASETKILDFANRTRDLDYEQSVEKVSEGFQRIKSMLHVLDTNTVISVISDMSSNNDAHFEAQSTIGRELIYAYDHAIHHLAIVKIGLRSDCPEIQVDTELGVAASTIKFRSLNH